MRHTPYTRAHTFPHLHALYTHACTRLPIPTYTQDAFPGETPARPSAPILYQPTPAPEPRAPPNLTEADSVNGPSVEGERESGPQHTGGVHAPHTWGEGHGAGNLLQFEGEEHGSGKAEYGRNKEDGVRETGVDMGGYRESIVAYADAQPETRAGGSGVDGDERAQIISPPLATTQHLPQQAQGEPIISPPLATTHSTTQPTQSTSVGTTTSSGGGRGSQIYWEPVSGSPTGEVAETHYSQTVEHTTQGEETNTGTHSSSAQNTDGTHISAEIARETHRLPTTTTTITTHAARSVVPTAADTVTLGAMGMGVGPYARKPEGSSGAVSPEAIDVSVTPGAVRLHTGGNGSRARCVCVRVWWWRCVCVCVGGGGG